MYNFLKCQELDRDHSGVLGEIDEEHLQIFDMAVDAVKKQNGQLRDSRAVSGVKRKMMAGRFAIDDVQQRNAWE